ncbi:MAG: 8-oxoguanine deaminase [Candidatus Dormibacterales bacterium]
MSTLVVRAGHLVLAPGQVLPGGWLLARDGMVVEAGSGPAPKADEVLSLGSCVAVPGLVNAHDHLYQWATRGWAPGGTLFEWLRELYPVWARLDAESVRAAARAAMARLLLAGCTLTADHHYVFHSGRAGIFEALVGAAREVGIRFHPCRGSVDLGASAGGLPPDDLVEDPDAVLAETERVAAAFHDPSPGSMCRVAVGPCSPFSSSTRLMTESAALARRLGLRMHTHLAETADEEAFCLERYGMRPLDLLEELGWLGEDVWLAHCVHLNQDEVRRLAESGTGVAHCPSSNMRLGSGAAPIADMVRAGVRVGLGVDGAASNEDYDLVREVHEAMLLARLRAAMLGTPRAAAGFGAVEAWRLATAGGAECLGRTDCGALEAGRCADLALYRLDDLGRAGISDPLWALALAPPARAEAVVVGGKVVVREGRLVGADEDEISDAVGRTGAALKEGAGLG